MRNQRECLDATISMLDVPTVYKIIDIMNNKMPLGSNEAKEIIESYVINGTLSDQSIDHILNAIKDKLPNIEHKQIVDNEMGIIPFYIKKLGLEISVIRERIKKQVI